MASVFKNVLSSEDLLFLITLPDTSFELTDSIRSSLTAIGMDLSKATTIPMKWIHGDTAPHVDIGSAPFTKTFLVYLSDSTGEFIVGDETYPIEANTGFVFDEGISHKTLGTGSRLLLGPMSERADPVGGSPSISYYRNEADARTYSNPIPSPIPSYRVSAINGFTRWIVAPNSTGPSPNGEYEAGASLDPSGSYFLYPVLGPEFVFDSPQIQTAANTVYQYKATYDAAEAAAGSQKVYTFKTDRERMQYLMGQFGLFSRGAI